MEDQYEKKHRMRKKSYSGEITVVNVPKVEFRVKIIVKRNEKKPEHRSSQKSTEEIEIHPVDNEECVEVLIGE